MHTLLSFANGYILDLSIRFVSILGSHSNETVKLGQSVLFLFLQFFELLLLLSVLHTSCCILK